MQMTALPFRSPLEAYDAQARELLDAFRSGDRDALRTVWHKHPRFLDETVKWRPKFLTEDEIRHAPFDHADAQLVVARWYDFEDWSRLQELVEAVRIDGSPVARFESAVEAVIDGDVAMLASLLAAHPDLIRARSTRVAPFDPPRHRATLLHYIAANGVEGYRQKTPPNAVAVAKMLLEADAEPDALASMYGSECTTMTMLVSSTPPARAGLQTALAETLIDFGASVEAVGSGTWTSPLMTALVFDFRESAEMLVRRGARVDTVAAAAGLDRLDDVRRLLPAATNDDRHRALALAAQLGHVEIVRVLLDAGEDPNRYNPPATHSHSTPLHQAVAGGRDAVVHLLVERGARLDIKDTIWKATPLGWAVYCEKPALADFLRAHGAP
jgi:ankyrin repeat protein